jgi:hypothetical protein
MLYVNVPFSNLNSGYLICLCTTAGLLLVENMRRISVCVYLTQS